MKKKRFFKKSLVFVLLAIFVLSPSGGFFFSAEAAQKGGRNLQTEESSALAETEADAYMNGMAAAAVYDVDEGQLLCSKNTNKKCAPASLAKIVTALTALKYVGGDEVFVVGSELSLVSPGSSLCFIAEGQTIKLKDLVAGMLIGSGNDAAYTVAVNTARRVSGKADMSDERAVGYFCSLMNAYCAETGAKSSNFINPDGIDGKDGYTTAADLVKITLAALKNRTVMYAAGINKLFCVFESGESIMWKNTNKLLDSESKYYYEPCRGLKTGTTGGAGCCLVSYAEKNGKELVCVALGCGDDETRFGNSAKLLELYFPPEKTGDRQMKNMTAAAVYDVGEGCFLCKKHENKPVSPSSFAKVVTAFTAFRYIGGGEILTVGSELSLVRKNSAVCFLAEGHRLKLKDLAEGMLIHSGNDAAYTIAVNTARRASGNKALGDKEAAEYFCALMDKCCAEAGAKSSHFVNPEGWEDDRAYTTVGDMVKICLEAMKIPEIKSAVGKNEQFCLFASGQSMTWKNTNKLLDKTSKYYYEPCRGIKTCDGEYGRGIAACAEKNGRELIVIAMGCKDDSVRFAQTRELFELGFLPSVSGDVNSDGVVTAADARLALRLAVGLEEKTPALLKKADIDGSGSVTASDARRILRCAVGLERL